MCSAFVEDCPEPVPIVFSIPDGTVQHGPLPKNYEWCVTHIQHARKHLEQMAKDGNIPEQRNIMWC